METRTMKEAERKYTYSQSQQISMQTGLIGYLRADMDSSGEGFFSSWNDFRKDLKTQDFKDEFDDVINSLCEDGNILHNRSSLSKFCLSTPESSFGNDREYGMRVNTEQYAYLMRLNPYKGEYNLYCYCYRRDWLDQHMEKAESGIRFINSDYKDLFRINDGDHIIIRNSDGEETIRTCRYIDETHVEVGQNLFHICEFAECMESAGSTYEAEKPILPQQCYAMLHPGELIIIKYGEKGYYKTDIPVTDKESMRSLCDEMNGKLGVSKAQAAAMLAGSMYGWCVPAANPKNYDDNGMPIKPKSRSDSREAR